VNNQIQSIPRPLVRTNQWVIVLSVLLTWLTKQDWILAVPLVAGLMGLIVDFNPIIRLAKLFLKKKPSEYIPEDKDQQQFNQVISVICLAGGFISYLLNWPILGYIFTIMVALAAFVAILGFCVGCFIRYQWKQYQYRRRLSNHH
jgi:divalent metal cation (Fe/Co/Zn/Cd) transporter